MDNIVRVILPECFCIKQETLVQIRGVNYFRLRCVVSVKALETEVFVKIVIRTFGLPKEIIDSDWFEVELPENATVIDLNKRLALDYPHLYGFRSLALFVNGENISDDSILHDGDQAIFAPVIAGG